MDLGTYMCSLNALNDAKSPCSKSALGDERSCERLAESLEDFSVAMC